MKINTNFQNFRPGIIRRSTDISVFKRNLDYCFVFSKGCIPCKSFSDNEIKVTQVKLMQLGQVTITLNHYNLYYLIIYIIL